MLLRFQVARLHLQILEANLMVTLGSSYFEQ